MRRGPAVWVVACALLLGGLMTGGVAKAQAACPTVDRMVFPVDRGVFSLAQDYAARSFRHDGRFHTGEDWFLRDAPAGGVVRAMANGRVTYAYNLGWGRDGGVVILEHVLPDESVVYSVYGHLAESDAVTFPAGGVCVRAGDPLGVVGDARPVPHVHLEVRTLNGRSPGPGYVVGHPDFSGYRGASAFVDNWDARLKRPVEWVTTLRDGAVPIADPLPLNDDSLLVLTENAVTRVLPDGRSFWRTALDRPAVALTALQGASLLHYADGTISQVNPDGSFFESWRVSLEPVGTPFEMQDALVFPIAGGRLGALDSRRREVLWTTPPLGAGNLQEATAGAAMLAVQTTDRQFLTLATVDRTVVDRAVTRFPVGTVVAPDGTLLVYTSGGMWSVDGDGAWSPALADVPTPVEVGALALADGGAYLIYDGMRVYRLGRDGARVWAVDVPDVRGRPGLMLTDGGVVLMSTGGDVAYMVDGGVPGAVALTCRIRVGATADPAARLWGGVGLDGNIRLMVGGALVGLDPALLEAGC